MILAKNFFKNPDNHVFLNRKAVDILKYYTTRFGTIKPRKYTGNDVKYQKAVRKAVLRARELGLLPYTK